MHAGLDDIDGCKSSVCDGTADTSSGGTLQVVHEVIFGFWRWCEKDWVGGSGHFKSWLGGGGGGQGEEIVISTMRFGLWLRKPLRLLVTDHRFHAYDYDVSKVAVSFSHPNLLK